MTHGAEASSTLALPYVVAAGGTDEVQDIRIFTRNADGNLGPYEGNAMVRPGRESFVVSLADGDRVRVKLPDGTLTPRTPENKYVFDRAVCDAITDHLAQSRA